MPNFSKDDVYSRLSSCANLFFNQIPIEEIEHHHTTDHEKIAFLVDGKYRFYNVLSSNRKVSWQIDKRSKDGVWAAFMHSYFLNISIQTLFQSIAQEKISLRLVNENGDREKT